MNINKLALKQALFLILLSPLSYAQTLTPEDVKDFDEATGVGCIQERPVTKKADYYFICKSSKSGELAWNAALYRSGVACGKDKISVYFNVPPTLPTKNGIYGAQVEVGCSKKNP